jgi:hypothetical protein
MEFEINEQLRKTKLVGIRLYKEEYALISSIAKQKKVSRSFVAESLVRYAMGKLKKEINYLPPKS